MRGVFKVPFNYTGNAANTAIDLAEITAAAGNPLVFLGYTIFQTSDFGDAAEEGIELLFQTGASSSGSGGSAVTPQPVDPDGPAANFAAEMGNTTIAASGTIVERGRWGWNVRMEKEKIFAECEQLKIPAGVRGVFKYGGTAPADSLTIRGELIVLEN